MDVGDIDYPLEKENNEEGYGDNKLNKKNLNGKNFKNNEEIKEDDSNQDEGLFNYYIV